MPLARFLRSFDSADHGLAMGPRSRHRAVPALMAVALVHHEPVTGSTLVMVASAPEDFCTSRSSGPSPAWLAWVPSSSPWGSAPCTRYACSSPSTRSREGLRAARARGPLTGVSNRRALSDQADASCRSHRFQPRTPVAVLMIDPRPAQIHQRHARPRGRRRSLQGSSPPGIRERPARRRSTRPVGRRGVRRRSLRPEPVVGARRSSSPTGSGCRSPTP